VLHHERQTDESQRHDNPQRRERNFDPQRQEPLSEPAIGRVQRRQRDAGHRRRQRKRQIHHGVNQPLERKGIAHQHPGDDETEYHVDQRGNQRGPETQAQRGDYAGSRHYLVEMTPAQS
jgi:hypothetical protein